MAKNHKKHNPAQNAKLLSARNYKDFIVRLKNILTLMSGEENTIKLLHEEELDCFYHFRYQAIRVEAGAGQIIDPKVLQDMRETAIGLFKSEMVPINTYGGEVSLSDYLTIVVTILTMIDDFKEEPFKNFEDFVFAIKPFLATSGIEDRFVLKKGLKVSQATTIVRSNLEKDLYWTEMVGETINGGKDGHYLSYKIYRHHQEKIQITIEGLTRPAVRVGWGHHMQGMVWCSRPPASFGLPQRDISHTLPVYIQTHALLRLAERLDCIDEGTVHYFVNLAIKNGRIHKTQNNSYLIEFHFFDMRAGYLVAVVQDEMVIVRTFLLLTNNGTPEGAKLANYTGLKKEDKSYLSLDKLSTFMDPALRDDESIQRIFFDAGCSDLFEITQDLIHEPDKIKSRVSTKVLLDYLMLQPSGKSQDVKNQSIAGSGIKGFRV